MKAPNIDATAAAEHFFAGAVAAGMTHVVISPGSRSTPLAIAADRTRGLVYWVHLDERSAAFVALGLAKATGVPVGLICTSGTAAANYLPALAEASLSNVPLVAVTSDRPPEHQHVGIGQSFDQRGLFHRHVRDEITMPVGGDGGSAFTQRVGWRAVATSIEQHGPVHVNWPFRLPLEPQHPPVEHFASLSPARVPERLPSTEDRATLRRLLDESSSPVIIAGPDTIERRDPRGSQSSAAQLLAAADQLGIPVLADVLSGLRGHRSAALIEAPSLAVESELPAPDLVIRLGNTPTAKSTRLWWETLDAPHVIVDPLDDWHDPSHRGTHRLRCTPTPLINALADGSPVRESWRASWHAAGSKAAAVRRSVLADSPLSEAHVAAELEHSLQSTDSLVASSSMPIRDIDMFTTVAFDADVYANRGINGIDGVVATAMGVDRASSAGRTVVLIGDVAALHDVGSILDAARHGLALTLVIPNNDGGGIFSFLPAREVLPVEQFDRLFHTPHGTTFEFLAGHPGISHRAVSTDSELRSALTTTTTDVAIVEVAVNTAQRLELQSRLLEELRSI